MHSSLRMRAAPRPCVARPAAAPKAVKAHVFPKSRAPVPVAEKQMFVGRSWDKHPLGLSKPLPVRTGASEGEAAGSGWDEKVLGITKSTWQKIIPLGLMFFSILFNYTILRDTKDVLVVTAPGSGAEIIPFLKTWVNLPLAVLFTVGYAQLANVLSPMALFYTCLIPFVAFFFSFAFIIYPARETLHPTQFCIDLLDKYGERFTGPIAILRNWTYCVFYVAAELWGSVVVSVLFWGFANTITTVEESERFYPLFGLGANIALIFSGQAVRMFSDIRSKLPEGVDGWGVSLKGMMSMVVGFGVVIGALYYYLQMTVVKRIADNAPKRTKKKKTPMGVGESFVFLAKSTYIRCMATLVVAYGISINLVEVTWKSKLKQQYPNPNDYSTFMGNFSTATGTTTFFLMISAGFIFKRFGWGTAALITPIALATTGLIFFSLVLFTPQLTPTLAGMGLTPLFAAVLVGAAQNVFSKGCKYALFDPCKEMAYIPLDDEIKTKGKAAIDVICNPLGKSGGALIQQFMIIGFGSLAASTPYLGVILLLVILAWINAAYTLNVEFTNLQAQRKEEAIRAAADPFSSEDGPSGATA